MLGSEVEELGTQAFISFLKLFFTCRTSHTSMGTTSHCWNESCFPPWTQQPNFQTQPRNSSFFANLFYVYINFNLPHITLMSVSLFTLSWALSPMM